MRKNRASRRLLANTGNNNDYDKPIPQAELKEALNKELTVLGRAAEDLVFDQLLRFGISFGNNKETYSMGQLESALKELFGSEAAVLLMERIRKCHP